ncbi:hypothetical protein TPAR_08219, partial [Tolypocladium paradoxum]
TSLTPSVPSVAPAPADETCFLARSQQQLSAQGPAPDQQAARSNVSLCPPVPRFGDKRPDAHPRDELQLPSNRATITKGHGSPLLLVALLAVALLRSPWTLVSFVSTPLPNFTASPAPARRKHACFARVLSPHHGAVGPNFGALQLLQHGRTVLDTHRPDHRLCACRDSRHCPGPGSHGEQGPLVSTRGPQ